MSDSLFPVAILAGGRGGRLRPVTESIPKVLMHVGVEPFLAHQLRLLRASGLERVVLCVGYRGEMVREFAGDGRRFGLRIDYSEDWPHLLGTAGAIRRALPLLDGRFFILGVGGRAAHASHAVNDFRKIAGIEAYAPTDNVSELTARTNDEGWADVFEAWLRTSHLRSEDTVLVFSVGGGSLEKKMSPNLVYGLKYARSTGARIAGVVGRDGGFTARIADVCVIVPTISRTRVTAHTEAFQAVVWHLLVFHPLLKQEEGKWESVT